MPWLSYDSGKELKAPVYAGNGSGSATIVKRHRGVE